MKRTILFIFYAIAIHAREEDNGPSLKEGNLALPTSQQPSPLFCFGQNIVDKGDFQLFGLANCLVGDQKNFSELTPYFIYGISDTFSLTAGIPFATQFKINNDKSSGIQDIFVQGEYAFFNKDALHYAQQATLVANITFPAGSTNKVPATGNGAPTFFLGLTANHMSKNWYLFASPGVTIIPSSSNTAAHNVFFYQWGIARNLYYQPSKMVVTLLLEFFGLYNKLSSAADIVVAPANRNFGINNLFIGPSLWVATERFILSTGIAFPAMQELRTNKNHLLFAFELGWKFN